jgi:hypothetical protein
LKALIVFRIDDWLKEARSIVETFKKLDAAVQVKDHYVLKMTTLRAEEQRALMKGKRLSDSKKERIERVRLWGVFAKVFVDLFWLE